MAGNSGNQKLGYRIILGAVVALLGASMLLYLVPQGPGGQSMSTDAVAKVGDQSVTLVDIRQQLNQIEQRNQVPKALEGLYAQQILNQLLFTKEIEYEAKRLGISVSDQERADRIRQFLPTAFNGDTFVGMDQYTAQVQNRFQLTVPAFEELIRQGLLEEKFRKLVTDGISVGPAELQQAFQYNNQKVKLDYALVKPEDLQAKVSVTDAEVKAKYDQDKASYQIPEKRVVRYGLIDINQLRQSVQITDQELQAQYQQDIQQYQVPNRVNVEHILFMTVGRTDAEVAEIRQKAEDVLKQAKKGANFEDLAKKYSEDPGTKEKGGQLGWIVQGQTVPEFEKAAFSLPKGSVSDLVRTQYGFHIIKVLDKETAHTKSFDEVKDSIRAPMLLSKADQEATDESDKIAAQLRRSNRVSLDDLAKQFHLTIAQTRPVTAAEPVLELGNSPEIKDSIFRLREGELSMPVHTDRGYIILSVAQIQPAHQGTLDEVRDKVVAQLKQQKAQQLAEQDAAELAKKVKGGEKFDAAAKSLGLDPKSSDFFSRGGSIPSVASGKQLSEAFQMAAGQTGAPLLLASNWLVYQVSARQEPNPADFDAQKKQLTDQVLQEKRGLAFEAFRTALEARLRQEGKLKIDANKLKEFGSLGSL